MIRPVGDARRYRVIVQSECGNLLASLVDNVPDDAPPETDDTCVVASVRDDPEFWEVMEQLQDLALRVVSLQDLDDDNGQATAPGPGE